jgi:hypothetical protein
MANLTTLSGAVPTRSTDDLDEDRYEFITLDQVEPNPGNPAEDGSVFVSDADGTRSFTKQLTLDGLSFEANTLTDLSANATQYYLVLSGDPTDGIVDAVGWSTITEEDTLQLVTERGDSTDRDITAWNLIAKRDLIAVDGDFSGNVAIDGILAVADPTVLASTLLVLDSATINGNLTVSGITNLEDSAVLGNRLFLGVADEKTDEIKILYRRQSDGLIVQGDIETDESRKINVENTDSNATHYVLFSYANNGLGGFDSVNYDYSTLTYQPFTNTLTTFNLETTNLIASGITDLDSTFVAGDIRIQTEHGRLLDSAGRSFVVYDSAGALLWGNNGVPAPDAVTGEVQSVFIGLSELLDVNAASPSEGQIIAFDAASQTWNAVPNSGGGGGGGVSLTDLSAQTLNASNNSTLAYNNITGVFNYTPPIVPTSLLDLSDILTDGLNGQVLSTDGNGTFSFIDNIGDDATGNVRVSQTVPLAELADGATTTAEFNTIGKSSVLHKVTVDQACWIRFYSDIASRTADLTRTLGADPIEGSGVIAEFIASSATSFKVTPGISAWVDDNENEIPATITNLSGAATTFSITVDVLKLENNNPLIPTYTISGPAIIDEDG